MEEFLAYPEPVENAVIRFNTDALCHLATAYSSAQDQKECKLLLNLMETHSKFLLETSEKMLLRNKFYVREVIQ
tara:strand:+ start:36 stop:257 length:222 start_codon:yes stop_codon:yes gene_type:complete